MPDLRPKFQNKSLHEGLDIFVGDSFRMCWGLVPGFVSMVLGLACWVIGFVCWVLGLVFWVLGFVFCSCSSAPVSGQIRWQILQHYIRGTLSD